MLLVPSARCSTVPARGSKFDRTILKTTSPFRASILPTIVWRHSRVPQNEACLCTNSNRHSRRSCSYFHHYFANQNVGLSIDIQQHCREACRENDAAQTIKIQHVHRQQRDRLRETADPRKPLTPLFSPLREGLRLTTSADPRLRNLNLFFATFHQTFASTYPRNSETYTGGVRNYRMHTCMRDMISASIKQSRQLRCS
jgi:hypothetical protein